ncbi:VOC family protein [Acidaminobacter sp. JC074]|uniref:VOC family protein n=1 Tax=Acidaminobacter sp. JC074 TaxID=2530199 RepID=UPI001F0DB8D5|nr:VOC family protein [Acidaminobacter sp. JC074]
MRINHVTYTVSDISEALIFYNKVFDKKPVAVSEKLAYYDLDGLWFALNVEDKSGESYQHVAFDCDDIEGLKIRLDEAGLTYSLGRKRHIDEKPSVYLRDPDKNLIEFHAGSLEDRLKHYSTRKDVTVL